MIHLSYANKLSWRYFRSKLLLTITFGECQKGSFTFIWMLIGWTSELKRRVVLPNIKKLKTAELHKQNTIEYDVANDSLKLIESYQKST